MRKKETGFSVKKSHINENEKRSAIYSFLQEDKTKNQLTPDDDHGAQYYI